MELESIKKLTLGKGDVLVVELKQTNVSQSIADHIKAYFTKVIGHPVPVLIVDPTVEVSVLHVNDGLNHKTDLSEYFPELHVRRKSK